MSNSVIVRPVCLDDLPKLITLLDTLPDSLTTMPRDENVLKKRIHKSIQSFYEGVSEAGAEQYLFVMEDLSNGNVVGTSSMIARVGGYEPFYTYEIIDESISHPPLGINKQIQVLHLLANHNGPSEIGSLYVHPDYRKGGLGKLLSLSRFMFAYAFPDRFRSTVIAELRGFLNTEGKSPFWETVGRHFFQQEFDQADFLSGIGDKAFIRDLMPTHPIYLPLLPKETYKIIGQVHPDTEPAKKILMEEGFRMTNSVDIFDAGPMLESAFSDLRCVQEMKSCRVCSIEDMLLEEDDHLISNQGLNFGSCIGHVKMLNESECVISNEVAEKLTLSEGDEVLFVSVK